MTDSTQHTGVTPVLEVTDLKKSFTFRKGLFVGAYSDVKAVDGLSLTIAPGETLALVGESGCGKSTVGKLILRLLEPTAGTLRLNGEDITHMSASRLRPYRKQMQIVFQDPYASLNPRMTAGDIVAESLVIHSATKGLELEQRVASLLSRVGLPADAIGKYPHEFSGGQRQRIGIAKALALNPSLIVCDEAVSALDVSIQAQIINLLIDLQQELGLSYLFISHDLAVVEHISHRVAVMYLGRIVETGPNKPLFSRPLHPYTEALLSAAPELDPDADKSHRIVLSGDVPSPLAPPSGCHFHTRCPYAMERCRTATPQLRELEPGHFAACHLHDNGVAFPLRRREGEAPLALRAAN
ncbi:MAG TPA: dipeptide ABC transporter ATP-binding protein [Devosiaceae bacterium]|jgi:oligopeptide/dipeptide ABC transporter ATP-binding protein